MVRALLTYPPRASLTPTITEEGIGPAIPRARMVPAVLPTFAMLGLAAGSAADAVVSVIRSFRAGTISRAMVGAFNFATIKNQLFNARRGSLRAS